MITVKEVPEVDSHQWNDFVMAHPESSYTHLYNWKFVFENSYPLECLYLGIYDENLLVGVLPIVLIKFPFRQKKGISLPYLNYSGILFKKDYKEELLTGKILEHLNDRNIASVEFRKIDPDNEEKSGFCTLKMSLPKGPEILWAGFKPKVRNLIRKAQRFKLETKLGTENFEAFYKIYSRNMRDLGTPVHSRRFFREILKNFPGHSDMLTVFDGEKAVASMFLMKYKNTLSDPWASSLRDFLEYSPNMLMYWEALKFGCENGFDEFDFGRSQFGSGTYNFKTQWGSYPVKLDYVGLDMRGTRVNTMAAVYQNNKASLATGIWKKLPIFFTDRIGPALRKYLP